MTEPKGKKQSSPQAKQDCFAYSAEQVAADGGCLALNRMLCFDRGACPFYKPDAASQRQKGG